MDLATWTGVLGLEGMEVVEAQKAEDGKGWRLSVISTSATGLCPHCHRATCSRHMVRWQEIHDLPVAGKHLVLDMQTPQFDCEHCGKTFTVHPACLLEGTHTTERLAEALTDCVNVSTLSAASAMYHIPESTVRTIFEKIVERRHAAKARTLKPITKLGVDEIHLEVQDDPKEPGRLPGSQLMTEPPPSAESGGKIGRE